jgi:CRISPR-associated protein Cas1
MDVIIDEKLSPLMNAMSRTTNSLYECFSGKRRKILYPEFSTATVNA